MTFSSIQVSINVSCMKSIRLFFCVFFFILFPWGCGKEILTEKTHLRFNFGTDEDKSIQIAQDGGIMVFGVEPGRRLFFSTKIPQSFPLFLDNGLWKIYAVGWTGPNIMEGTVRCGEVRAELSGGNQEISLTLDQNTCANGRFAAASLISGNQFLPLEIKTCMNTLPIVAGANNCDGTNLGVGRSFRVSYPRYIGGPINAPPPPQGELVSACIPMAVSSTFNTTTALKLPFGAPTPDLFFPLNVTAYWSIDCSGPPHHVLIPFGAEGLNTATGKVLANGAYSSLFVKTTAEQQATLIKDINPGGANSSPGEMFVWNNRLYMVAQDTTFGAELWASNGSTSGTVLVHDHQAGASLGLTPPLFYAVLGNFLYYGAFDAVSDQGLYRTDGTDANTQRIFQSHIASSDFVNGPISVLGNELIFKCHFNPGTDQGVEICKSSGAIGNGNSVTNLTAGAGNSINSGAGSPMQIVYNGYVFYSCDTGTGLELCKTNGITNVQLPDINAGVAPSTPDKFVIFQNKLFFTADDGTNGTELWSYDGTSATLFKDINTGVSGSGPDNFVVVGDKLFFSATTAASGTELWVSDGTPGNTVMVTEINPAGASSNPTFLTAYKNKVYFQAIDTGANAELWHSDGTPGGTVKIELMPAATGSYPQHLLVMDNVLYFIAAHPSAGTELWRSDGLAANTVFVTDISPGAGSGFSPVGKLAAYNGHIYFAGNDGLVGVELWRY